MIEDSGGEGSYVLGQSMTDSALNKSALVEVDASGNTWVTIRLNLMDNIQSPQFQVDGSRNGKFSSVTATVMQEDFTENTTDFRMQVPDENAIIRCNMYVVQSSAACGLLHNGWQPESRLRGFCYQHYGSLSGGAQRTVLRSFFQ